jgi:hypothetical protein
VVLSAEDDAEMREKERRKAGDDVHAIGSRVLKVHIDV